MVTAMLAIRRQMSRDTGRLSKLRQVCCWQREIICHGVGSISDYGKEEQCPTAPGNGEVSWVSVGVWARQEVCVAIVTKNDADAKTNDRSCREIWLLRAIGPRPPEFFSTATNRNRTNHMLLLVGSKFGNLAINISKVCALVDRK